MQSPKKRVFSEAGLAQKRAHMARVNEKRRSPELKKAQEDRQQIIELYNRGVRVDNIADQYSINRREVYRIMQS